MNNQLHEFAAAHSLKVKRDQDRTFIIEGKRGHIFADGTRLCVYGAFCSRRSHLFFWHRLLEAGCPVIKQGSIEIFAAFDPLDDVQAQLAIRIARIARKRRVAPNSLAALERHRHIGQFRRVRSANMHQDQAVARLEPQR
jgi:hypothetical protein